VAGVIELTGREIRQFAREAGLAVAAVTTADPFDGLADLLIQRIDAGHLDGLDWFTHERARESADPRFVHAHWKSIVSVGLPYYTVDAGKPDDGVRRGVISRYARGIDYHRTLEKRMRKLTALVNDAVGHPVDARQLVDTARIVDRAVAARAGLGWTGKHSCIIVPGHGSWVMLGEVLMDIAIAPDLPLSRNCGRCSICIDRCPTNAIVDAYTINAPRCLSFQTIEQAGAIPHEIRPLLGDWVFGCDICQEVCPYTGAAAVTDDPDVLPRTPDNAYPALGWLLGMTEAEFREVYRATPVLRTKRVGLARNAAVALGNIAEEADLPLLVAALHGHDEPLVRGHAAWAIGHRYGIDGRNYLDASYRLDPDAFVREECGLALTHLS
jgi:epoxyqueuosine reductase